MWKMRSSRRREEKAQTSKIDVFERCRDQVERGVNESSKKTNTSTETHPTIITNALCCVVVNE